MREKIRWVEWTDKIVALACLLYQVLALYDGFSGYAEYNRRESLVLLVMVVVLGGLFIKSLALGIYYKEQRLILVSTLPLVVLLLTSLSLYLIANVL